MSSYIQRRRGLRDHFTILGNDLLKDPALDWKSLGLLVYLLHLPADFKAHISVISRARGHGSREAATAAGFQRLRQAGYMEKELVRDERGRIKDVIWHVADQPVFKDFGRGGNNAEPNYPELGNPVLDNPGLENRGLQSSKGLQSKKKKEVINPVTPAKPARFDPLGLVLPTGLKESQWQEWISYRRSRKFSTTEQTALKQIQFLAACIAKGLDPSSIIDASIRNGWHGLFEPTTSGSGRALAPENYEKCDYGSGGLL